MQILQTIKTVPVTPPAAIVDNASFPTTAVDTKGFHEARFVVMLGATDIALAAFKLQESDESDMSGATDVDDADFAVSPLTLPSDTDDNKLFAIHVTLKGRKRFLDLVLTAGNGSTGTFAAAWCDLGKPAIAPNSVSERGFTQEAIV